MSAAVASRYARALVDVIFDPKVDAKLVDLSPNVDNVQASAVNFYEGVTEDEVNLDRNDFLFS